MPACFERNLDVLSLRLGKKSFDYIFLELRGGQPHRGSHSKPDIIRFFVFINVAAFTNYLAMKVTGNYKMLQNS